MRKNTHSVTRLNFDFPPEAHRYLKIITSEIGVSIKDFATEAILEKLQSSSSLLSSPCPIEKTFIVI